jgi:hypothetical protein
MTFANCIGYWVKSENNNAYWKVHSDCMKDISENPLSGKMAEKAAALPGGGYE